MGSRIRENPEKIYEVFMEIGKANGEHEEPFLIQNYPRDYSDEEVLKSVPKFAFPCDTERYTTTVDHFTFVLTEIDSTLKFVFCRHATGAQTCLCIVSYFPWFEIFYNLLNQLAEMLNHNYERDMTSFLRAAYVQDVPAPGVPVTIAANQDMLNFTAPEVNKLPSIPSNRNLTEYYNAMDTANMMIVFASMLNERRIIVTSRRLSRLTACIHASVSLLYPMFWQHLFIPILPAHLLDYLSAPMPYVIGVHATLVQKMKMSELGDAIIVDVDNNTVQSEYEDLEDLPSDISSYLKRHLKGDKVRVSMQTSGDAIPKAFLMALVRLIGGYRDALRFKPGEPITFDPEAFVLSRPQSMQPFLENMLQLQIFQQFINERLDMLNCGQGFSDIFEAEALQNADKLNTQSRYKEWLTNMKKQGNKFQKGGKDIWAGIKEKVKSQGKKAYTGIKNKMADLKKEDEPANMKTKSMKSPSTQKMTSRDRPSTVIGQPLKTLRPPRPSMLSSPTGDKLIVASSSQDRISRYKMITVEEKVYDDSDVELSYNRVSVNLLSDPDIQQALNRAASAENIVRMSGKTHQLIDHLDGTSSGPSSGRNSPSTVSSSSALEYQESDSAGLHSQANRDTFGNVPFIDISSEDEYVGLSNSSDQYVKLSSSSRNVSASKSSQEDQSRPVAPPRRSRSPLTTMTADRLISDRSKGGSPPHPAPHRPHGAPKPIPRQSIKRKSEGFQQQKQLETESLMQFQNLELEDSFDPFKSPTSQTVAQIDKLKDLASPTDDDVNNVTRTPAFRMPGTGVPKRLSMKRDKSLSPEKDSNAGQSLLDFDPLANTSQGQCSIPQNTGSQGNPTSPELLQDWNIDHLQTKTYDLGPLPKPGFVQRTAAEFALGSSGQNNIGVSYGKRLSPAVLQRPFSVHTDHQSSSSSPYSTLTPYNPLRASSYGPVTSSPNIRKAGTSHSRGVGNADPFADLVGIQLGPTSQPPVPNKGVASPATQVNKWETFE
ncbi:DENN domain-containing protein 1A-like isoform X3 [Mizuhopecten yessoensis]|uniref:DENN domain-containing protein 1A-like isoform X3 n=1 Tax=Mizuhopecten yessoensis TaxID=6573 RepID=UPI000B45C240|nr:DENN domain-containing protein 1A-like isoform X3 [Mizuhopecten yessoensis]